MLGRLPVVTEEVRQAADEAEARLPWHADPSDPSQRPLAVSDETFDRMAESTSDGFVRETIAAVKGRHPDDAPARARAEQEYHRPAIERENARSRTAHASAWPGRPGGESGPATAARRRGPGHSGVLLAAAAVRRGCVPGDPRPAAGAGAQPRPGAGAEAVGRARRVRRRVTTAVSEQPRLIEGAAGVRIRHHREHWPALVEVLGHRPQVQAVVGLAGDMHLAGRLHVATMLQRRAGPASRSSRQQPAPGRSRAGSPAGRVPT